MSIRFFVYLSIFIAVYFCRLFLLPPAIKNDLSEADQLAYTFTLLDVPVSQGNKLLYRLGHTTFVWGEYHTLKLGARYRVIGKPTLTTILSQNAALKLDVLETQELSPNPDLNLGEYLLIAISRFRSSLTNRLSRALPEPESSLAAGILLGIKRDLSYDFHTSLVKSGTLHTVAASGYNVNLIARYILIIFGLFFSRRVALTISGIGIFFFCLLAGGSAAVVRAGVMGVLILIGVGLGRQRDAKHLLVLASASMLLFDPLYLFDVGWQLSVAATFGILYLEPIINRLLNIPKNFSLLKRVTCEFVSPTLAATITTAPITFFTFGQISFTGPLTNLLILPTIPLIMALTTIFLLASFLNISFLTALVASALYLPLTYFVRVVTLIGSI